MARMLPPEPWIRTKSPAEIALFWKLQSELDHTWVVLHSVGVAEIRNKPWSEIDFVCISPSGIYCIEVKGGGITRQDGAWIQTNRRGEEFRSNQSPFEQVEAASTALQQFLWNQGVEVIRWRHTVVGYGVATPDIQFDVRGPDILEEVVYDVSNVGDPFAQYLQSLGTYWHRRLLGTDRIMKLIEATDIKNIIYEIRGDFDLRPSLKHRVGQIEEELIELTKEQYEILDHLDTDANARMLIKGGAGTGKTLCAIEMARYHALAGRKVLLCCFNRALAYHLRAMTSDLSLITVSNLHDLMETIVDDAGLLGGLSRDNLQEYYRSILPEVCIEAVLQLDQLASYDALILDEGQDLLLNSYIEVLGALLKDGMQDGRWTIFWDPNQDIYQGIDPKVLDMLRRTRPLDHQLTKNCRNTRQISELVSLLSGIEIEESVGIEGIQLEAHWYRDNRDQRRKISRYVNRLLGDGIKPSDIVILSPRRLENSSLSDGLTGVPFPLVWWEETLDERHDSQAYIKFSTLHSFKGLESEVVILADVEDLVQKTSRHQLYVGASRGRVILAPFISETQREVYEERSLL